MMTTGAVWYLLTNDERPLELANSQGDKILTLNASSLTIPYFLDSDFMSYLNRLQFDYDAVVSFLSRGSTRRTWREMHSSPVSHTEFTSCDMSLVVPTRKPVRFGPAFRLLPRSKSSRRVLPPLQKRFGGGGGLEGWSASFWAWHGSRSRTFPLRDMFIQSPSLYT